MTKLFYIGERINPQFDKSYYNAYGQLSKKEAKKKSECLYGQMILSSFESADSYNKQIENLKEEGFKVNITK